MTSKTALAARHCRPASSDDTPLSAAYVERLLACLDGWTHERGTISRTFTFPEFGQTMAFVNAVAWIAHREDHHPDLAVGYSRCRVEYSTHAIGGLSENDFICAAKVDALLAP